mmetsp:Transcript_16172/g.41311  ORF Transcript_16172/g.41311 Transcript_16172/m.41311 type:complete len:244 (+) Transcript_16172:1378-2109(+)
MTAAVEGDERLDEIVPVALLHCLSGHCPNLQLIGNVHTRDALHAVPVCQASAIVVHGKHAFQGQGEESGIGKTRGVQVENGGLCLDILLLVMVNQHVDAVLVMSLAELVALVPEMLDRHTRLGEVEAKVLRHIDDGIPAGSSVSGLHILASRIVGAIARDGQEDLLCKNLECVTALHCCLMRGGEEVVAPDKVDILIPKPVGGMVTSLVDSGKHRFLVVVGHFWVRVHTGTPLKVHKSRHAAL